MTNVPTSGNSYRIDGEDADVEAVRARVAAERVAAAARSRASVHTAKGDKTAGPAPRAHRAMSASDRAGKAQVRARQKHERQQELDGARLLRDDRRRRRVDEQEGLLSYRVVAEMAKRAEARRSGTRSKPMITVVRSLAMRPVPSFRRHKPTAGHGATRGAGSPQLDADGCANIVIKIWPFGDANGKKLGPRAFAAKVAYIVDELGLDGPAAGSVVTNMVPRNLDGRYPEPGGEAHSLQMADLCDALSEFERDAARTVRGQPTAQHFTHMMIALPAGLTRRQRQTALHRLTERLEAAEVPFCAALHAPSPRGDQRNYHIHIVSSLRHVSHFRPGMMSFSPTKTAGLTDEDGLRTMRVDAAHVFNRLLSETGVTARYSALTRAERNLDPRGFGAESVAAEAERRAADLASARARLAELARMEQVRVGLLAAANRMIEVRTRLEAVQERFIATMATRRAALGAGVAHIDGRLSKALDDATSIVRLRARRLAQAKIVMLTNEHNIGSPQSLLAEQVTVVDERRSALTELRRRFELAADQVGRKVASDVRSIEQRRSSLIDMTGRVLRARDHVGQGVEGGTAQMRAREKAIEALRYRQGADIQSIMDAAVRSHEQNRHRLASARLKVRNARQKIERHLAEQVTIADQRRSAFTELGVGFSRATAVASAKLAASQASVALIRGRLVEAQAKKVAATTRLDAAVKLAVSKANDQIASQTVRLTIAVAGLAARGDATDGRLAAAHAKLGSLNRRIGSFDIEGARNRLAADGLAARAAEARRQIDVRSEPIVVTLASTRPDSPSQTQQGPSQEAGTVLLPTAPLPLWRRVWDSLTGAADTEASSARRLPVKPTSVLAVNDPMPVAEPQTSPGMIAMELAKAYPDLGVVALAGTVKALNDGRLHLACRDGERLWAADIEGCRHLWALSQSPQGRRYLAELPDTKVGRVDRTRAMFAGKLESSGLAHESPEATIALPAFFSRWSTIDYAEREVVQSLVEALAVRNPQVKLRSASDGRVECYGTNDSSRALAHTVKAIHDGPELLFSFAKKSFMGRPDPVLGWDTDLDPLIPPRAAPVPRFPVTHTRTELPPAAAPPTKVPTLPLENVMEWPRRVPHWSVHRTRKGISPALTAAMIKRDRER